MRFEKVNLVTFLLLLFGQIGVYAQSLYVRQKVGKQTSYLLKDIKKISFSSGNINATKISGMTDSYSLATIQYLN